MSKISQKFIELAKKNELGLMSHVVCGFPEKKSTIELVQAMAQAGSDFIELQIPFSDPSADGPAMMHANTAALEHKITVLDCFKIASFLSQTIKIPLVFMTYINIVFNYGLEKFVKDSAKIGISGLIIPDYPIEEANDYVKLCRKYQIDPIFVISPNISDKRLIEFSKNASGFIYCTTRTGTTGVQDSLPSDTINYLERVKKIIKLPRAVGFGISKSEHIKALKNHAECAIVGSAVIEILRKNPAGKRISAVKKFISSLKSA